MLLCRSSRPAYKQLKQLLNAERKSATPRPRLHASMNTTTTAGFQPDVNKDSQNPLGRRTLATTTNNGAAVSAKYGGKVRAEKPLLRRDRQLQAAKGRTLPPHVPGTVNLQVLGTGGNGAPCAVYLFTDQSRYLFNCGEGLQRLAHEHKTRLSRLEQVFVTRNTWEMIGGFPGLALTVQDAGMRELTLHGPPHLNSVLLSMRRFVALHSLQVTTKDYTQISNFEDGVMSVKCIPLYNKTYTADVATTATERGSMVVAYKCQLKPRPGALNLEKCVAHGVPPGPLLGLLKNGSDVTLDDGTVVKSKDVSEPNETALSFIFLDIPSEDFLDALLAHTALLHGDPADQEQQVAAVVHFGPKQIIENNCYRRFMQGFGSSTQHIYLHKQRECFSGYSAAHRIQYQLNLLHPRIFPLLAESEEVTGGISLSNTLKKTKLSAENEAAQVLDENTLAEGKEPLSACDFNTLTNLYLRPKKGLDRSVEAKLTPSEYINETHALEGFPALLEQLRTEQLQAQDNFGPNSSNDFPVITFLGTGSCVPNKTRNVSAILLQTQPEAYVLLDCGEGTLGQIVRFYGRTKAAEVMRHLRVIYVSHLHADHHIGLIGLLNERKRLFGDAIAANKLLLLAPRQIESWLNFYDQRIERISDTYTLVGNGEMLEQPLCLTERGVQCTGVSTIGTCLVRHCPHSFGVCLTLEQQHAAQPVKITYSGDTMPCADLVTLGRNSTVLIHEATMEDDLIEEARAKLHSTISEGIEQGRAMEAKHIILTHFSQRYAKLPRMRSTGSDNVDEEKTNAHALNNVAIAFDNMQVTLADLPHFQLIYPALRALFAEHAEDLEQKALKREMKLERKRKMLNEL